MRKIAIVLAILMLVPASAFGMQMLTDSGMAQITGQSGVSIAMDDVQLFINIGQIAYIDNDGLSTSSTMSIEDAVGPPGALYIQDFQIDVLNINAIVGTNADAEPRTLNLKSTSAGHIPLFYNYASTAPLSGGHLRSLSLDPVELTLTDQTKGGLKGLENYTSPQTSLMFNGHFGNSGITPRVPFIANAITIEVTDRLPALTEGLNYNTGAEAFGNHPSWHVPEFPEGAGALASLTFDFDCGQLSNVGGVFITLPTAEIYIQSLSFTVAYTGDVYAHTLETIRTNDLTAFWGVPVADLYVGPMGALTSHAINDNGRLLSSSLAGVFGGTSVKYPLQGDFGTIEMRDITFTQLGGWMEIAPH